MSGKRNRQSYSPSDKKQLGTHVQAPKQQKKLSSNENTEEIWTKLEAALLKQSESITSLLTLKIAESEERLSKKIDADIAALKFLIDDVNKRLSILESNQDVIETVRQENQELKGQIKKHEEEINNIITCMERNEEKHQQREIMSHALLHGVPLLPTENLKLIFNNLCVNIGGHQPPSLQSIFRLKSTSTSPHPPILIKFLSPHDKSFVLRSIANYRKTTKQQPCLRDLGFDDCVNSAVFIHECLTVKNRSLLQYALKMKKEDKLFSVYTMRGRVYVKKSRNENAILIENADLTATSTTKQTTTIVADIQ